MRFILCAYSRAGHECLLQLLASHFVLPGEVFVFTHDTPENVTFLTLLKNLGVRFSLDNISRRFDLVSDFSADFLVSVYYRHIISAQILERVDYKAMNLHPSLLPDYRGCMSSVWAILNNEPRTGITFHYMDNHIDTGNLILQITSPIFESDTAYSLYHKLISLFSAHFSKAIDLLVSGYDGLPQSGSDSYFSRELPYGGKRSMRDISHAEAVNFVRAMYFPPFAGARFLLDDREIEITEVDKLDPYRSFFRSPV